MRRFVQPLIGHWYAPVPAMASAVASTCAAIEAGAFSDVDVCDCCSPAAGAEASA
jgi:hypothetical protein